MVETANFPTSTAETIYFSEFPMNGLVYGKKYRNPPYSIGKTKGFISCGARPVPVTSVSQLHENRALLGPCRS